MIRDAIQQHPAAAVGAAVVLIVIVIVMQVTSGKSAAPVRQRWYFDLNANELVAFATTDLPPVTLPSGHQAVLARVFACGQCAAGKTFAGYYARSTPQGKAESQQPLQKGAMPMTMGRQIARPAESGGTLQWVDYDSPQGLAMQNLAGRCAGNQRLQECYP